MKFGQLIEYNMRNIFLEKLYTKRGRETISKLFSKLKISTVSFYCMLNWGILKYIETKFQTIYFYLI